MAELHPAPTAVDATRPLANGETDGAWLLLAPEDRAALEAEGWVDGRPPAPARLSWWARLGQRLAGWKTLLDTRKRCWGLSLGLQLRLSWLAGIMSGTLVLEEVTHVAI